MEMIKVTSQQAANTQENATTKGKMKEGEFAGILKAIDKKEENPMDLPAHILMGLTDLALDKEAALKSNALGLQSFTVTGNGEMETKVNPELLNSKIIEMDLQKEILKEIPKEMLKEVLKEIPGEIKNRQLPETDKLGKLIETGNPNKALKDNVPKVFAVEYREINYLQKAEGEKSGKMIVLSKLEEKVTEESGKSNLSIGKTNVGKNEQSAIFSIEKLETAFKLQTETPTIRNAQDNITKVQDAMIKLFETTREGQTTKMRVSLHPENLGKVDIGLTMEGGKLTASIQVESNQIRELFANKMGELNQSLAKQGLVFEKIHIEVKTQSENLGMNMNQQGNFNQQGKRQWSSRMNNIFKDEFSSIKGIKELSFEKGVSLLA